MFILPFPNGIVLGQDLVVPGPVADSPLGLPETIYEGKPILSGEDGGVIFVPADSGKIVVPARAGFVPVRRAAMRPSPDGSLAARQRGGGGLAPAAEGVLVAARGSQIDAGARRGRLRPGSQEALKPSQTGVLTPSADAEDFDTEGEC